MTRRNRAHSVCQAFSPSCHTWQVAFRFFYFESEVFFTLTSQTRCVQSATKKTRRCWDGGPLDVAEVLNSHFSISRITGFYKPSQFLLANSRETKTPTYPVMCQFPLFAALCAHNLPVLQTHRRTLYLQHTHDKLIWPVILEMKFTDLSMTDTMTILLLWLWIVPNYKHNTCTCTGTKILWPLCIMLTGTSS